MKFCFIFTVPLQALPNSRPWMLWMTRWRRWGGVWVRPLTNVPAQDLSNSQVEWVNKTEHWAFIQLRHLPFLGRTALPKTCFSQVPSVCLINHVKNKTENKARIMTPKWQSCTVPSWNFSESSACFYKKAACGLGLEQCGSLLPTTSYPQGNIWFEVKVSGGQLHRLGLEEHSALARFIQENLFVRVVGRC